MTVAPADDLGDIHPDILAAIESNDKNDRALATIWLDAQSIREWIPRLGFTQEDDRKLIIEAWAAVGRSARTARGESSNDTLAAIQFGSHSPLGVDELPPKISAADFGMVITSQAPLEHARKTYEHALRDEAIEVCEEFIGRLRTHLHT